MRLDSLGNPLNRHLLWGFQVLRKYTRNIPDVVGLQDAHGTTGTELVGELKTPWVDEHDLQAASAKPYELRRTIAQPLRDMQKLNCEYGFISTYEDTIFLRQFQSPGEGWEVWYSPAVSSLFMCQQSLTLRGSI